MTHKFDVRLVNKMKCRHTNDKPLKEILLYIITYHTNNNSNLWYRHLQVRTITRMRPQWIILYEHQRRELPKVPVLRCMYIYNFVSRYCVADLAYTLKVTQMDNNSPPQLSFFYIGRLNATCFGLTRNHHQENKAQNKLKLMKTARQPDFLWILFNADNRQILYGYWTGIT